MSKKCSNPECQAPSRARGVCLYHYERLRGRINGKRAPWKPITLLDRFEAKYIPEPNSGCWIWLGSVNSGGRATMVNDKRRHQAARVAFVLFRGEITGGLFVCHSCDNPACVNPDHLWLGTNADNMRDMHRKGRHRSGQRAGGGVSKHTRGNWRAYTYDSGKQIHIGSFPTAAEASAARAAFLSANPFPTP